MPQVEVRTRLLPKRRGRGRRDWSDNELLMELLLTPRGSGNRRLAVALAKAAKNHPELGPHVKRTRAGASKVWIVLTPSLKLVMALAEFTERRRAEVDVPGQLPLFGGPAPA